MSVYVAWTLPPPEKQEDPSYDALDDSDDNDNEDELKMILTMMIEPRLGTGESGPVQKKERESTSCQTNCCQTQAKGTFWVVYS